jgi:hypothetical protein
MRHTTARTVLRTFAAAALVGLQACDSDIFTDAGTRLAFDLRDAAATMRRTHATTFTLEHHPRFNRGRRCPFTVKIGAGDSVACFDLHDGGSTTALLRWVAPADQLLSKSYEPDQSVFVDLRRDNDRVRIVALR